MSGKMRKGKGVKNLVGKCWDNGRFAEILNCALCLH